MFKSKIQWGIIALLFVIAGAILAYQVYKTNLAHTTFDRYYAFRGCIQLIDKTETFGDCKLSDGKVIKIIQINGKWYLDGDGPGVW